MKHDKNDPSELPATPATTAESPAARPFAAAPAGGADLSAEVVRAVERLPEDRVRCTRVGSDVYRCNWWAPHSLHGYDNPSMAGLTVTTHRVRQSQFLRVTRTAAGLVIAVCPPGGGRRQ